MNERTILFIGGGVLLVAWLLRNQAAAAVEAVANVNEGTPFEGTGIIGTAGNVADRASGGFLSNLGRAIGDFLDPINRRSLDELTGTGG